MRTCAICEEPLPAELPEDSAPRLCVKCESHEILVRVFKEVHEKREKSEDEQ
jgi:hypothetical protein